jgi:hypothetical protein
MGDETTTKKGDESRTMIQQEDSEERRLMSQGLVQVMMGLIDLMDIAVELRKGGLGVRRIDRGDMTRFVIYRLKTGTIYDTFEYHVMDDEQDADSEFEE